MQKVRVYRIAALASGTLLLIAPGCASASQLKAPNSEQRVFEGEIFFWNEFNLYPYPRGSAREKECISGTFPLKLHREARRKFSGRWVRIYGQLVSYDSLTDEVGFEKGWRGGALPKYCPGNQVILGEKIELLESGPAGNQTR